MRESWNSTVEEAEKYLEWMSGQDGPFNDDPVRVHGEKAPSGQKAVLTVSLLLQHRPQCAFICRLQLTGRRIDSETYSLQYEGRHTVS